MAGLGPVESIRQQSVGIMGAGAAGLITGHTLLRDGFQNVQLLTRDKSAGGVWARERVYPGVSINNVHGEFSFSALPMPAPLLKEKTGNRLSGDDMCAYMETFADTFLAGKIRFETEILDIRRGSDGAGWEVEVLDLRAGSRSTLRYVRIILCTGSASTRLPQGCSQANIPEMLSAKTAEQVGFRGLVLHSSKFASHVDQIVSDAERKPDYSVVVVGGGKSGQDIASHLTRQGIKVTVVFKKTEAVIAAPIQLPDCIRKSRCLGVFSPHIELRTGLERFLHTTTLGSIITTGFWNFLNSSSFKVLNIAENSPLREAHSLFWGIQTSDEGIGRKDGFHALVHQGKIKLVAPTRAVEYAPDKESIVIQNGQTLTADTVILATGFSSSWAHIFTEETIEELGMGRRYSPWGDHDEWTHYKTLSAPPTQQRDQWKTSIYRGLVPSKNITKRDFAINGALFTTNNGYGFEVIAHWISSYFLGDNMRLPSTVEEALVETERKSAWIRKRYPGVSSWVNESYGAGIAFWSWPQAMDELLDDMGVPSMRSGGNWLTWPFKVISLGEIATLKEEREAKRAADTDSTR